MVVYGSQSFSGINTLAMVQIRIHTDLVLWILRQRRMPPMAHILEYDSTTSANWLMCTSNNSTRTKTPSSIAVVASTWTLLTIKVNSDGTSADFFCKWGYGWEHYN